MNRQVANDGSTLAHNYVLLGIFPVPRDTRYQRAALLPVLVEAV